MKFPRAKYIIVIVLSALMLYFLSSGYIMQSAGGLLLPVISYAIGIALYLGAIKIWEREEKKEIEIKWKQSK